MMFYLLLIIIGIGLLGFLGVGGTLAYLAFSEMRRNDDEHDRLTAPLPPKADGDDPHLVTHANAWAWATLEQVSQEVRDELIPPPPKKPEPTACSHRWHQQPDALPCPACYATGSRNLSPPDRTRREAAAAAELWKLREERRTPATAPVKVGVAHGTDTGYKHHVDNREPMCFTCGGALMDTAMALNPKPPYDKVEVSLRGQKLIEVTYGDCRWIHRHCYPIDPAPPQPTPGAVPWSISTTKIPDGAMRSAEIARWTKSGPVHQTVLTSTGRTYGIVPAGCCTCPGCNPPPESYPTREMLRGA